MPKDRIAIAADLASEWHKAGVRYAIVHGVDDYPRSVGRDLDILVDEHDEARLLELADAVFQKENWRAVRPPDIWGKRIVAFAGTDGLELHTVVGLSWREIILVAAPNPSHRVHNLFPRDVWASFAKQILMPGFRGDLKKVLANATSLNLSNSERRVVSQRLSKLVSKRGASLADEMSQASADDLIRLLPIVRAAMIRRRWRTAPLSALLSIGRKLSQRVEALVFATGVAIRVLVDPASGDEIARRLASADKSVFTDFVVRVQGARPRSSGLTVITEAARRLWWRSVIDRAALGGQRIVFHIVTDSRDQSRGLAHKFAGWIDRIGLQPQARLVVGDSRFGDQSDLLVDPNVDPESFKRQVANAAIEAFVEKHSRS